jgi:hypothetical protein
MRRTMPKRADTQDIATLLIEYEQAQSSAQHHDALVWTVSNTLLAISIGLFGFMMNAVDKESVRCASGYIGLVIFTAIVGIALVIFANGFSRQLASVKCQKYSRCRVIEKRLGMRQHSSLKYEAGSQSQGYAIVTMLLVVLWVIYAVVASQMANPDACKAKKETSVAMAMPNEA